MKRVAWVVLAASVTGLVIWFGPVVIPAGSVGLADPSKYLASGQWAFATGLVLLGGLLTTLTPCVYPLIPITVAVFGAKEASSKLKAFGLVGSYQLGLATMFSVLGVVVALSGKAFGSALANPFVIIALATFLLTLAGSMFGAFEMSLPTPIANRLHQVGGSGMLGAFLMGTVAAFLAAPCAGPVLTGLLAFVATTRSAGVGGALMFVYALGFGIPFFIIGVFAVRLPKSGAWMEHVKSVFGIALVALAVSYLQGAFPAVKVLLMTKSELIKHMAVPFAAFCGVVAVLFGAIHGSFKASKFEFVSKTVGVLLLTYAILFRFSAAEAMAEGAQANGSVDDRHLQWALHFKAEVAKSSSPFETVLAKAKEACKPVMIDFFADWCGACKELDARTYTNAMVVKESKRFVNVKVDGTNEHEVLDVLYRKFGVQGLPTIAFIDSNGQMMRDPKVLGYLGANEFLGEMKKVRGEGCDR